MAAWRAMLFGPAFTVLLHTTALRHGTKRLKATVCGELAMSAASIAWIFGVSGSGVLNYHVMAMLAAHCMTAFFAVWTVHHHCDRTHYLARTLRSRMKNAITFDMFRHIGHHLFPAVPTRHLAKLSERLDVAAPELKTECRFLKLEIPNGNTDAAMGSGRRENSLRHLFHPDGREPSVQFPGTCGAAGTKARAVASRRHDSHDRHDGGGRRSGAAELAYAHRRSAAVRNHLSGAVLSASLLE